MKAKVSLSTSTSFLFAIALLSMSARAETYIFSAQPDPPPSGPVNFSWFSGNNWFTNDSMMTLHHANALPAPGDTAQIGGAVNAAGNVIHLDTLILSPNASVNGGDFIVSKVQIHGGSGGATTLFDGSVVEVLSEMDVFGGSCALNSSDLSIDFGATCFIGLGGLGQLNCNGSQISNDGEIVLYPNSSSALLGGTNLINLSGAIILGNSNTVVTMGNFDNRGTVQCDSGTLTVSATTWNTSGSLGKYKTTASNAVIAIGTTLTVPPGVTNIFSGPGVSQLQSGANIQGNVLVGVLVSSPGAIQGHSASLDPGTLQFAGQVGGPGVVEVVSLPATPSVLMVNSNLGGSITGLVVNVDVGGQFNINYASTGQGLTLNGATINNSGTTTWGGHGGITMNGNATFNNQPVGLFDSQIQNSSIDGTWGGGGPSSGGTFNNAGTFRKSAGTNIVLLSCDFNNSGLLDLQTGQIQVFAGTSTGTFSTAPGAEIRFGSMGGTRTNFLNPGVQFFGTNFVRMNQLQNLTLNGNVTLPNFSFESGTLDGPGNLTVSNVFNWSGNSTIQGGGIVTIPAGATFNVSSGAGVAQHTINNSGTTIMTNGFPAVYTNVVFNNLAGGLLEIHNNGGFGFPNPPPSPHPVFNNYGTIRTVSTGPMPLSFNVTNYGSVLITSNSFNTYLYDQAAGTTLIASNATLNPQGFVMQGGSVGGAGTVIGNSANGYLISGGTVSPGNPFGILNMSGGAYTQTVAGALSIVIGGTNATSQFSRLAVSSAALNGTLNVSFTNGFQPSVGDVYYFLSTPFNGSVTGRFSTLNGLNASNGVILMPAYQGFGVSLIAVTNPVLSSLSRSGKQFTFSFPTTTGLTNVAEYSDSLNPPVWKPFATNNGNGSVTSATDSSATNAARFYRLRFQQ